MKSLNYSHFLQLLNINSYNKVSIRNLRTSAKPKLPIPKHERRLDVVILGKR